MEIIDVYKQVDYMITVIITIGLHKVIKKFTEVNVISKESKGRNLRQDDDAL